MTKIKEDVEPDGNDVDGNDTDDASDDEHSDDEPYTHSILYRILQAVYAMLISVWVFKGLDAAPEPLVVATTPLVGMVDQAFCTLSTCPGPAVVTTLAPTLNSRSVTEQSFRELALFERSSHSLSPKTEA